MRERFAISVSQACRLALLRRSTWYRRGAARDQTPLRLRIPEMAMTRPRFGYQRIHVMLRREGWRINHKRVHRLYRLEGLQARMRVRRRKRLSLHRGPMPSRRRPITIGAWISFSHRRVERLRVGLKALSPPTSRLRAA
jgi:putative transposase